MGRPATLKVDILGDARGVGRAVDQTESKLSRLGSVAAKAGKAAALGLAAIGVAAVGMAIKTVGAASESQQSIGAVESVYGKYAASVEKNAKRAANAVGLSATEYRNMAAIVGSQLKNMGRDQASAAAQSDRLIKLGADLAATFGGSVADAVGAVSSLLRGERDPIERYGVAIKQADIDARLAKMGLDDLTGASKRQAEATATLALLTEQTASAHGQFARESDTLAGQQARLAAGWDDLKVAIGERFLPIATHLFRWLNDDVRPAVEQLADKVGAWLQPKLDALGAWIRDTGAPALQEFWHWIDEKVRPAAEKLARGAIEQLGHNLRLAKQIIDENKVELRAMADAVEKVGRALNGPMGVALGKVVFAGMTASLLILRAYATYWRKIGEAVGFVIDKLERLRKLGESVARLPFLDSGLIGRLVMTGAGRAAMVGQLATAGYRHDAGALATAALVPSAGALAAAPAGGSGAVYVDQRRIDARQYVDGALDPVAVARQLRELLGDLDVILGRAPAWSGAT